METIYVVSAFIRGDDKDSDDKGDGDKVLLLQRGPNRKVLSGFWEMPGGKWNTDKGPEDTLVDRVSKETGLVIRPTRPIGIFSYINDETGLQYREICYHAVVEGDKRITLSPEHGAYKWLRHNELPEEFMYEGLTQMVIKGFDSTRKGEKRVSFPKIW